MDIEEKINLVKRSPTEEIIQEQELNHLFQTNNAPKHYLGIELSGILHIGSLLITGFKINDFIKRAKDPKDPFKLMGFGHRVYKNYDPRASVMRKACHDVLNELGRKNNPYLGIALDLEDTALNDSYFKKKKLYSVSNEKINVILSSSATSGKPSMIGIDSVTSKRQTVASAKVMSHYLGDRRRPFLILDEDPLVSDSNEISARSAATRGFLILASKPNYFLINN